MSVRCVVRNIRTLFRGFNEEDACALLSAYGLHAFELERAQNNHPFEQKERNGNAGNSRAIATLPVAFPGPIAIGVHPDIFRRKRRNGLPKHTSIRRAIERPSSLSPVQDCERRSVPPSPKLCRICRSDEPNQCSNNVAISTDMAFVETVERMDFDWPDSLAVEGSKTGVAGFVKAMLVSAGFVAFARRAISVLCSAVASSKNLDITPCKQLKIKE
jgi:hypothetical protein